MTTTQRIALLQLASPQSGPTNGNLASGDFTVNLGACGDRGSRAQRDAAASLEPLARSQLAMKTKWLGAKAASGSQRTCAGKHREVEVRTEPRQLATTRAPQLPELLPLLQLLAHTYPHGRQMCVERLDPTPPAVLPVIEQHDLSIVGPASQSPAGEGHGAASSRGHGLASPSTGGPPR